MRRHRRPGSDSRHCREISRVGLDRDGGGKDGNGPEKAKVIRWNGAIPPQKWTTFYMKVVSPFAAVQGLSLRVAVEVPADQNDQQAKSQMERIRNALRDLNLDDSVDLS